MQVEVKEWSKLSEKEKKEHLYFKQKAMLEMFFEKKAISKEQFEKSINVINKLLHVVGEQNGI